MIDIDHQPKQLDHQVEAVDSRRSGTKMKKTGSPVGWQIDARTSRLAASAKTTRNNRIDVITE